MPSLSPDAGISMLKRLRENPMIAASILLPLVIVVFFLLATAIPKWFVDPPGYSFLFTVPDYSHRSPEIDIRFDVANKRLRVRAYKTNVSYRNTPRLYLYDHEKLAAREISIDLPATKDSFEDGDEIVVAELANRTILTERTAPDGYEVRGPEYRNGNLVTALFGSSRHKRLAVQKAGAVFEVPHPSAGSYYYNSYFLGWLAD